MSNKYTVYDDELGRIERTVPPDLGKSIGPDLFQFWYYVKFNSPTRVYETVYQHFLGKQPTYDERIAFYIETMSAYEVEAKEFTAKWSNK